MNQDSRLFPLPFPLFTWISEPIANIILFVLGLAPLFLPDLINSTWYTDHRELLGISIFTLPISFPIVMWCIRTIVILIRRIASYPKAYNQSLEFLDLSRRYSELLLRSSNPILELTRATYQKGKFYIELKHPDTFELKAKDLVAVVDIEDNKLIGHFNILKTKGETISAVAIGDLDAIWKSYLYKNKESSAFPNLMCYRLSKENQ